MKSYNEMAESVLKRRDRYKMKRRKIIQGLTGTACCCTMILCGVLIMNATHLSTFDERKNKNGIADLESVKTYGEEQSTSNDNHSNYVPFNTEQEAAVENEDNYVESSDICQMLETSPEVYAGSYINEKGEFVVWLTENTPENRAAFCRDFGRDESNTVFQTAQYSYVYLSELQEKISKAMTNKEIPFVVGSALRDDTNRIHISVTTEDQELINTVLAYDMLGGAIVVEYSSGAATEDLGVVKDELLENE